MNSKPEFRKSNMAIQSSSPAISVVRFFASIALLLLVSSNLRAQYGGVPAVDESIRVGFESITEDSCREVLQVLAGEQFEGRGTGQTGYMKAAHWVAGKAAEFGLEPAGEGGTYFQMLPMRRRMPDTDECRIICADNTEIIATGNFGLERFTDQFETSGGCVFLKIKGADATISDPVALRDKVIFYSADEKAAATAPRMVAGCRPAAAFRIIESDPLTSAQMLREGARTRSTSVSGTVTRSTAESIAVHCGGNETWAANAANVGVEQIESPGVVRVQVRVRERVSRIPNVVAWLEGSDPNLKHEYVVVGSHLDHLGVRSGEVFPGADDNGSGSTAVLNIARAMAANPQRPPRSVLFMWFAAEEIGLIGSKHYCENPLKPVEDMTCMLNIDMVGRNEESDSETMQENEGRIHLVGSQRGDNKLHEIILAANEHIGFGFEYDEEDVFGRSDQANFYNEGVPVAFLFGGFHPDYHQPSDTVDKINFHKVCSAARLYYVTAYAAATHGHFDVNPEK